MIIMLSYQLNVYSSKQDAINKYFQWWKCYFRSKIRSYCISERNIELFTLHYLTAIVIVIDFAYMKHMKSF